MKLAALNKRTLKETRRIIVWGSIATAVLGLAYTALLSSVLLSHDVPFPFPIGPGTKLFNGLIKPFTAYFGALNAIGLSLGLLYAYAHLVSKQHIGLRASFNIPVGALIGIGIAYLLVTYIDPRLSIGWIISCIALGAIICFLFTELLTPLKPQKQILVAFDLFITGSLLLALIWRLVDYGFYNLAAVPVDHLAYHYSQVIFQAFKLNLVLAGLSIWAIYVSRIDGPLRWVLGALAGLLVMGVSLALNTTAATALFYALFVTVACIIAGELENMYQSDVEPYL